MKKTALLFIILSFISCKTIQISENKVFKEGKYDYNRYNRYIENSDFSVAEKKEFSQILTDIIKTDKSEIINKNDFHLSRNFFKANDSIQLEYFEFAPKNYDKTGVFFLGNGSSVVRVMDELEELSTKSATKIYLLNYRGYGKSDGRPSFKTQFKDNTSFLNFITEKDHQKPKIVIGYSIGTIAASYLASENNLDELYLLAPISNAEETIAYLKKDKTKGLKSIFRPFIKITTEEHLLKISNTEKIKNYTGKLTILHALDDSVLPYKMGKELFDISPSSRKEMITIENGGHGSVFFKRYWDQVIEMMKS